MRPPCILLALATLLSPGQAAGIDLDDTTFIDRQLGIRLEVPEGWQLHRQTGFPSVLLLLLHSDGGASIRLATGKAGTAQRLADFVQDNRKGIESVGLRVTGARQTVIRGKQGWRLELRDRGGKVALRQLYLPHGDRALVLTLTAPPAKIKSFEFDLGRTVELMELTQPSSVQMRTIDTSSYPSRRPANDNGMTAPASRPAREAESRPNRPASAPATLPATAPTPSRPAPTGPPGQELELEGLEAAPPP